MNPYIKRIVKYGLIHGLTFIVIITTINYWITGHNFYSALLFGIVGGIIVAIGNSLLFYHYAVPKYILNAVSVDLDVDEKYNFNLQLIISLQLTLLVVNYL